MSEQQKINARTIALGDIHGCAAALQAICEAIQLKADDTLVMLGDAIDRGPESAAVLGQLLAIDKHCRFIPILGNHEQMMLDAFDGRVALSEWLIHGGAETLDSYGQGLSDVPEEHLNFVRSWVDYYETTTHFFAHGNYVPNLPLDEQPWEKMRWRSLNFSCPGPHDSGKVAVLGHTANRKGEVIDRGHLLQIDTHCHGGGWLTALEPTTGRVWQADRWGRVRNDSPAS